MALIVMGVGSKTRERGYATTSAPCKCSYSPKETTYLIFLKTFIRLIVATPISRLSMPVTYPKKDRREISIRSHVRSAHERR